MPLGGELVFRLAHEQRDGADIPESGRGDWVVVTVRDTGSGMPPDARERIFEPFYTTKVEGRAPGSGSRRPGDDVGR